MGPGQLSRYGLEGTGIGPRRSEIFRTGPDRPWGPLSFLHNGYRVIPGDKAVRGNGVDHPPHLAPRLKKE
jgi:hypothetical protein